MLVLVVCAVLSGVTAKCHWNAKCPYRLLGAKTPYDVVRGDVRDLPPLEGCSPVSMWMMLRHGARQPDPPELAVMRGALPLRERILDAYEDGNGTMCAQDIENLRNWPWSEELYKNPSELTENGKEELRGIGRRFAEKFPDVFDNLQEYKIRASVEKRTQQSAKAFVEGLQELNYTMKISTSLYDDLTARPYRHCKKRFNDILKGSKIPEETDKYLQSKDFNKVLSSVQKRTGVPEVTAEDVLSVYEVCREQRAHSARHDPWCAVLADSDLKTLEYLEDLQYYYRNGHGEPMNAKLGAASLQDLYSRFNADTLGSSSFTAYVSHDTMLGMLYAALGLYRGTPLAGDVRDKRRIWRTSLLTPFAANFVAVLNKCEDEYKVQVLVNEHEVPVCGGRACEWQQQAERLRALSADLSFCNDTQPAS